MALTNHNLELIKAVARNDIHSARTAALASLAEDNTKKNAGILSYYKNLLIGNASTLMTNLPSDIQTMLVGTQPCGFDDERYYVRESDKPIVESIRKMKLIADEMSYRRIPYRNTAIFFGPSGTGKTELGRYIAYSLNLPFFYVSFATVIDSYMGNTAKNLRKVFDFCNSIPCILMLDEIDCIATTRSSGGSKGVDGEIERTTVALMQELDRLPNHVVLLAATNRIDMVDEAMMRRFSIKHEILNMSTIELYCMVKKYLNVTDTLRYVNDDTISELTTTYNNPGQIMPELIRTIGEAIYEEKKDSVEQECNEQEFEGIGLWEVTYTWKKNIAAETEEDAIAIGQKTRNSYSNNGAVTGYTAKRAEFLTKINKD